MASTVALRLPPRNVETHTLCGLRPAPRRDCPWYGGWRRMEPAASALPLGLFGHREDVVARHLPDQLGMRLADVALDLLNELVVAVGAHDLAAFAVDDLRHDSSSG